MSYDNLDGDALRTAEPADQARRQQARSICDRIALSLAPTAHLKPGRTHEPELRAQLAAVAAPILQALGLAPYEPVDRLPFQGVDRYVHGSRSAVERHRTDHTAMCGPCLRWVEVDGRKAQKAGG